MWTQVILAQFEIMSWHFTGLTDENRKNLTEWLVWDEI
jgi:hypothetical protein